VSALRRWYHGRVVVRGDAFEEEARVFVAFRRVRVSADV
jgi:hypothetical protein